MAIQQIETMTKGCNLPFPKKCDIGISKKYSGVNLSALDAKVFNAPVLNRIWHEIDIILGET